MLEQGTLWGRTLRHIKRASGQMPSEARLFLAEDVGFEPTRPFSLLVFKTSTFNHSANPPKVRKQVYHKLPECNPMGIKGTAAVIDYRVKISPRASNRGKPEDPEDPKKQMRWICI